MNKVALMSPVAGSSDAGADLCPAAAGPRVTGYLHPQYAESLAEFGTVCRLSRAGGFLLSRPIPDTVSQDAMGCYPLFCCRDWAGLGEDLRSSGHEFVSVTLVTDPFGDYTESGLHAVFDRVVPFKLHFVVDLHQPLEGFSSATHRKFARRAQRQLEIEVCLDPMRELDTWCGLYGQLVQRHGITGIQAFSRAAFAQQLQVPGMVMFRARHGGETVGMDLWYVQGEVAQGHLAAFSERGYDLRAAYGLKLAIIEYFRDKVRWLNLGGSAGLNPQANDGLTAFKRGWSSGTRMAWLCGRILDPARYAELVHQRGFDPATPYFPAYRCGEF